MRDIARFLDLQKQGFMRSPKAKRLVTSKPMVECHECLNWHTEGKHTAPIEVRRQRRAERKARLKEPACIVQHGPHGHRYGATRTSDPTIVALFIQSIRKGKLYWKKAGTARWNDHHGLYSLPHDFSGEVAEKLADCLRFSTRAQSQTIEHGRYK